MTPKQPVVAVCLSVSHNVCLSASLTVCSTCNKERGFTLCLYICRHCNKCPWVSSQFVPEWRRSCWFSLGGRGLWCWCDGLSAWWPGFALLCQMMIELDTCHWDVLVNPGLDRCRMINLRPFRGLIHLVAPTSSARGLERLPSRPIANWPSARKNDKDKF